MSFGARLPGAPVGIPTLDALVDGRTDLTHVPSETRAALARRAVTGLEALLPGLPGDVAGEVVGRVIGASLGRALAAAATGQTTTPAEPGEDWVTPEEAATITKKTRDWLVRHHRTLPFARKLTGKTILFSRRGAQRWLETRGR